MPIQEKPIDVTKGQISDESLERVLELYGYVNSWSLLPIVPMNGTLVVLNAKAETTKKAVIRYHGKQFLLKQVPWYCSRRGFIDFMLSFHQFLYDENLAVPKLVNTLSKELFLEYDNQLYYLQEFLSGKVYSSHLQQIFQAGLNLGKIHSKSLIYTQKKYLNNFQANNFRETSFQLAQKMVEVLEEIAKASHTRINLENIERVIRYSESTKLFLKELESEVKTRYDQTFVQVHGDYNPFNLLYGFDESIVATIDWENAALDNPVHDLAEGLLGFSFNIYKPYSTRFYNLSDQLNSRKAVAFIKGYQSSNAITYESIKSLLPQVVGATFIELFSLGLVRGDYDFDLIPKAVYVQRRIIKDIEQLLE